MKRSETGKDSENVGGLAIPQFKIKITEIPQTPMSPSLT